MTQNRTMKKVLFLQHGEVDKPGLLAEILSAKGIGLEVCHAWRETEFPSLDEFHGLALGGGGQSAWEVEKYPYLDLECRLVLEAIQRGLPVIGLCLGAQLLARASGAKVSRAEQKEIGFFPVELNAVGRSDSIVSALPPRFPATHWHGDVFEIPKSGQCLGSSALTQNQILRCGPKCLGFQFHLEMTPRLFEELVWDAEDFFRECGLAPDALILEAREVLPRLEPMAREVFSRWAALI